MATYKRWNQTEIDFIQNNHSTICDEILATKLSQITGSNITTAMVRRQRRKLKLSKPRGRPSKSKGINLVESENS
jgi:hypothetical protein